MASSLCAGGRGWSHFPSPFAFTPGGQAESARRHAGLTCGRLGGFVLTRDVARRVSPPHLRTGSEASGLLEGQGAERGGGGILKSATGRPSFENLAFFFFFNYLFIYFWLCWVFVSVRRLFSSCGKGGHSSSRCAGLSLSRPLLLRSTGSRRAGSVVVAHGPSCSAACGILRDQGSNPCPLHRQADSQPLRHQGSPRIWLLLQGLRSCHSGCSSQQPCLGPILQKELKPRLSTMSIN